MGSPGSRAMANVAAWPLTPAACALAPSSQQAELAAPQSRDGTHARTPSAPIRLLAQGPGAWTRARWATPEAEAGALLLGLVAHGTSAGGGRPRVAAQRLGETGLRRARESRALASARESRVGVWDANAERASVNTTRTRGRRCLRPRRRAASIERSWHACVHSWPSKTRRPRAATNQQPTNQSGAGG